MVMLEWNCVNGHTWWCFSGSISKAETIDAVASSSLPKDVASQVFDFYFEKRDNQCEYSAKERDLCAFFGEYLLQTGTSFHFEEFSKLWQQAVPGGDDKTSVEVDGVLETDRYLFRTDISQVNSLSIFCHRDVCTKVPLVQAFILRRNLRRCFMPPTYCIGGSICVRQWNGKYQK